MVDLLIDKFGYGLMTHPDPAGLPVGGAQTADNVVFDDDDLRARPGRVVAATLTSASGLRAVFPYVVSGGTPSHRFVGVIGTRLYWTDAAGTAFTPIDDGTVALHATNTIRACQHEDNLYIVDGSHAVLQLASTGTLTWLTDISSPTNAITPSNSYTGTRLVSGTVNSTDGRDNYVDVYYDGSLHFTDYTIKTILHPVQVSATMDNTARVQAMVGRLVSGTYTVSTTTYNCAIGSDTASVACEIVIDNAGYLSPSTMDNYFITQLSTPADLSTASSVICKFKFATAGGIPAGLKLVLGQQADTDPATMSQVTISLSGVTANVDASVTVDISGVAASSRNNIGWVGYFIDNWDGCNKITRISTTGKTVPDATHTGAVYFIAGSIISDTSTAVIQPGEYEFTYTLYNSTNGESREYMVDAFAAPYPSWAIQASDVPLGIQLDLSVTSAQDTEADEIRIYGRGGVSPTFRRLNTIACDGSLAYSWTWDGGYDPAAETLPGYVGRPPVGMTMLTLYRGRMVYAGYAPGTSSGAKDVLYFSNFGDPGRCPINTASEVPALQLVPSTYGGWVDIERFGNDVTGIAAYGPTLVAFKQNGIWQVEGDPGDSNFGVREISRAEGCVSHESLCNVGGTLFWQAKDKVLAWDGQGIRDIGAVVAPTVKSYTAAQQIASFGIYDPRSGRYHLVYPSTATPSATPSSTVLVWQLRAGYGGDHPWALWTAMPGSCGCYAPFASTPGVYLGDHYGAGNTGKLFRLDADTTTDAVNDGAAASINWQWVSGELALDAQHYLQLLNIRASVETASASGTYTVLAGYLPNNQSAYLTTRTCTLAPLRAVGSYGVGTLNWTPAPRGEMETIAVKLGYASAVRAVRAIVVELQPRGTRRGRTVARA